jgi:beta-propeller repeat-containing protein
MSKNASHRMLVLFPFLVGFACPATAAPEARVSETYGKLPLHFEANRGQTHEDVRFLARGAGYSLFLTPTGAALTLTKPESPARRPAAHGTSEPRVPATGTVLRMTFAGANPDPRVTGLGELPGKANYFIGNDPAKWRTNVPTYAKVRYTDLYPRIDLLYYGNQRQLEYDLVVRPGADPTRIVLDIQGAERLEVDKQGDLVLQTSVGPIRLRKPVTYQEIDGSRREIAGGYVRKGKHQVGFKLAAYDASQALVIDPVLSYSTYLGGSGDDGGSGIVVDTAGNAYVTGATSSIDFPTTAGTFQTTKGGGDNLHSNAFVTKFDPTGSALVYSTYLGGSDPKGADSGRGIAVDADGNAYVTGATNSIDFPTTAGVFQPTKFGGDNRHDNAFVTKLNPSGSALVYSTYLGGDFIDRGTGIALDAAGNVYVTGGTMSMYFPTTPGAFQTSRGTFNTHAFVTKLSPTGSDLVYSTYLGGSGEDVPLAITVDAAGNAFVTGYTLSSDFPTTAGAFQTTKVGGVAYNAYDGFVTKLNPAGCALVYSTYLAGSGKDIGAAIAVDADGNAYVTGGTDSIDFPTTAGAFQTTYGGGGFGGGDAFVTKLDPTGSALVYSTFLGGSDADGGAGIAVDATGNAYVTGGTYSANFPTTAGAFQTTYGGGASGVGDAFVTQLTPTGSALVYSTYLGGSGYDVGSAIALDTLNAYVTGTTSSTDFPTTAGAFQTTKGGGYYDAFVAKIGDLVPPPPPPPPPPGQCFIDLVPVLCDLPPLPGIPF